MKKSLAPGNRSKPCLDPCFLHKPQKLFGSATITSNTVEQKSRSDRSPVAVVHTRCKIKRDPAECFLELKRRGLISSSRDAVVQEYSLSP